MTKPMSFYHGNMLSSQVCFVLDSTGLPCGANTITSDPVPLCESHARELCNKLDSKLKEVAP